MLALVLLLTLALKLGLQFGLKLALTLTLDLEEIAMTTHEVHSLRRGSGAAAHHL
jgi:hypothetical protein